MTSTFEVRGQKVRSASQRRYIVVIVDRTDPSDPRKPWIHSRSDNIATAKRKAQKWGYRPDSVAVVIDTATGQEV